LDLEHLDNIYSNNENNKRIEECFPNTPIEIEFSNINYQSRTEEFIEWISKIGIKFEKTEFAMLDDGRRHKGKCKVTVTTKADAYKVVDYSRKKFGGRSLRVQVLDQDNTDPEDNGHGESHKRTPYEASTKLQAFPPGLDNNKILRSSNVEPIGKISVEKPTQLSTKSQQSNQQTVGALETNLKDILHLSPTSKKNQEKNQASIKRSDITRTSEPKPAPKLAPKEETPKFENFVDVTPKPIPGWGTGELKKFTKKEKVIKK